MPRRDIVVVGASAGALDALKQLVAGLPSDFPAAVLIVRHMAAEGPGILPEILSAAGPLPAVQPVDGDALLPGRLYVAAPDHHLLLEPARIRVTRGPKENRFRPSVDALFRSAAFAFGSRVIGVVLSGYLDDGAAGLWAVKDRGGIAIVQDPAEALYPSMPNHALQQVAVDYVVGVGAMSDLLVALTQEPVTMEGAAPMAKSMEIENRIAMEQNALEAGVLTLGALSPYTCPECHGVLVQLRDSAPARFRCHTGHAFSLSGLLAAIGESIDQTLWSTVRVLEERLLLLQQMEEHARDMQAQQLADLIVQQANRATQHIQLIRQIALAQETLSSEIVGQTAIEQGQAPS
jgi:two-component system, chemotaxis family, protein-glutamate methylesterase/glutaminase